ncbi:MAG TPA: DUF3572 family protein [Rhodobacterales bacterium]|nr:DUF3572 family protein [Rhodobacterales bacterium]
MQRNIAETIGLQALGWLAGNDELLPVFLGATGAGEDDLRAGAQDPAFLASVLDFLTMDDAWVVAFCEAAGLDYTAPLAARQALPGGQVPSWT